MARLPDGEETHPRTLKPEDGGEPPASPGAPPRPPAPTTLDEANSSYRTLVAQANELWRQYEEKKTALVKAGGAFGETEGNVVRMTSKPGTSTWQRDPNDPNREIEVPGPGTAAPGDIDAELNSLYQQAKSAETEAERFRAEYGLSKTKGPFEAGASYVDTEKDKAAEVKRQFADFMDRAKALYGLEDAEAEYTDTQNRANAADNEDVSRGYLAEGQALWRPNRRPESLSGLVRPSLPNSPIRPIYYNNSAVGLPGPEGFSDPDYDSDGNYIGGYAAGTGGGLPDPAGNRIPQDLKWMIGFPDVPQNKRLPAITFPKGGR